jgi:hypothetical protein
MVSFHSPAPAFRLKTGIESKSTMYLAPPLPPGLGPRQESYDFSILSVSSFFVFKLINIVN